MKWYGFALTAVWAALLTPSTVAAPAPRLQLASHVSAAPAAKAGRAEALSVALTDRSGRLSGAIVDLEVYDGRGKKVAQHVWQKQTLTPGRAATYRWRWTPTAPGAYTVKVGVFGAPWKPLYYWDNAALGFKAS